MYGYIIFYPRLIMSEYMDFRLYRNFNKEQNAFGKINNCAVLGLGPFSFGKGVLTII